MKKNQSDHWRQQNDSDDKLSARDRWQRSVKFGELVSTNHKFFLQNITVYNTVYWFSRWKWFQVQFQGFIQKGNDWGNMYRYVDISAFLKTHCLQSTFFGNILNWSSLLSVCISAKFIFDIKLICCPRFTLTVCWRVFYKLFFPAISKHFRNQ